MAKEQPLFVIHYAGGSSTHDEWAQNGIVSLGGPTQANQFFAGRRPFRWDVFPNGTETADWTTSPAGTCAGAWAPGTRMPRVARAGTSTDTSTERRGTGRP